MILDYNPANNTFFLLVPRGEGDIALLMREYGLDMSAPASSGARACLYTRDPFCAASFHEYASAAAREQLGWVIKEVEASGQPSSDRHVDLPSDRELMPFQRADVDYIMRRPHALDGDEMGLGKTPTAIAVANEMQAKRVLVVCPASVRLQWMRRIAEWSTMPKENGVIFSYPVTSARYGTSATAKWTVVSYDLARRPGILRGLVKQRFDLLILDEVHNCKTGNAARTRAIFGYHDGRPDDGESEKVVTLCLAECCERILALSGTPILNRPSEVYTLMRGLNWDAIDWMSEQRFRERFNPQSKGKTASGKVWVHEEMGREPELGNRMRAFIMCRHLEADVRDQLRYTFPEPIYDLVYLDENTAIRAALQAEKMLDIDPDNLEGADIEILGQVSTVRKMMGIAMAPGVADYVATLLDGGERKLVLFAWHIEVLDILVQKLARYGVVRVDGSDGGNTKDAKVQKFVTDPSVRVIAGNILALGVGVDGLQKVASHVLLAEPDWVPGNNEQPIRRLNRIGQQSRVLADFFVVANSMAERVLATALRKNRTIDKVLDRKVAYAA